MTAILLCRAHVREKDEDISEMAEAGQGRKAPPGGDQPERPGLLVPITASLVYSVPSLLAQDRFRLPMLCGRRGKYPLKAYPQSG